MVLALMDGYQTQLIVVIWLVAAIIFLLLFRNRNHRNGRDDNRDYKVQLKYVQRMHMRWESGTPQESAVQPHNRWADRCECLTCLRGDRDEIKLLERSSATAEALIDDYRARRAYVR